VRSTQRSFTGACTNSDRGRRTPVYRCAPITYAENEDPQPQVLVALGFLMTN
jgi:hypothetical protein